MTLIHTESTPNPNSLKFIVNQEISGNHVYDFQSVKEAKNKSLLAIELFKIKEVKSIMLGSDFVTISKKGKVNWEDIKTKIIHKISDFISSGKNIIESSENNENNEDDEDDDMIVKQIKELIEKKVRPAVAMDGGDIVFCDFNDGIVFLKLKGSCQGCPSAVITLKNGIENMLKHYIPEVKSVEQIE